MKRIAKKEKLQRKYYVLHDNDINAKSSYQFVHEISIILSDQNYLTKTFYNALAVLMLSTSNKQQSINVISDPDKDLKLIFSVSNLRKIIEEISHIELILAAMIFDRHTSNFKRTRNPVEQMTNGENTIVTTNVFRNGCKFTFYLMCMMK